MIYGYFTIHVQYSKLQPGHLNKEKKLKRYEKERKKYEISLFIDGMILYTEDTKIPPEGSRSDKQIQHMAGYKIKTQKSIAFL